MDKFRGEADSGLRMNQRGKISLFLFGTPFWNCTHMVAKGRQREYNIVQLEHKDKGVIFMAKDASFHIRTDVETKERAEKFFQGLGTTVAGAFNMFLQKSFAVGGLPFDVRYETNSAEIPEERLFAGIVKAEKEMASGKAKYISADEVFDELEKMYE